MFNIFCFRFIKSISLFSIFIATGAVSAVMASDPALLTLYWQIPIAHEDTPIQPPQQRTIIDYDLHKRNAVILFHGNKFVAKISEQGTGGEPHQVEVEASLYGISATSNGEFLAVGSIDRSHWGEYLSFSTLPAQDVFLARINSIGEVIWQNSIGGEGFQIGSEVIELADGNIVVAGSNDRAHWLWSFDAQGSPLWERGIGHGGGDIAALPRGGFVVIGTEARGKGDTFIEDVKMWILNNSGKDLHNVVVREAINTSRGSHFLSATVAANADAIAISSAWPTPGSINSKRLEIAKYTLGGDLLWSIVPEEQNCEAVPVLETDGDIVVACATTFEDGTSRDLVVTRYSSENGSSTKVTAALPNCQQSQTSVMIRILRNDPSHTLLLGSRPPYNVGESCTWLGTMLAPLH